MNCPDNIDKLKKLIVRTTEYKGIVIKALEEKPKVIKKEKEISKQIKIKTEVSPVLKQSLKLILLYLATKAKQYNEPQETPIQEEKRIYNYKKKEYRKQVFNYIEEEKNAENLTDEEITIYLVYSLVVEDRLKVKTNWRNQLENAFKALRLGDLIIFGRYSETPKKGYTLRGRNYDSTGADAYEYKWSTEIMQTVFAIIRTKLRKDVLEVFDAEIATINCYFRSNLDDANDLKDAENYPIKAINYLQAAENWHASAIAEGTRINPNVTDATIQKGFRDIFDENFTRDSYNCQIGNGLITSLEETTLPNNEEDFFRRADTLFKATRVTMNIMEKSKNEKTNHYSQKTRINNVQTSGQPSKPRGEYYSCGQIGHFAKECPKRKEKESYNRVQSTYKNYNGKQKKTFVKKYCSYCGKDNRYHTKTCPNNNASYYEGKRARGPIPMVHKYNNFKSNRGKGRP
ncbi:6318_t:CDS:2 [Dentiscutata erythropus]|uniref:6318_t:CDS:1 n=1 Tax=Dentiscutata erythropus TaxID=1348616 RepID=A0A9N9F676_9GLOM|nr:6318_t:CDS:2 [Dentiscutata erythropus]